MYKHKYEIILDSGLRIQKDLFEDLEDIKRYFYNKKYSKCYDNLNWYLEDGAIEYMKEIENNWMHNKIDTNEIYKDEYIYNYHAHKIVEDLNFQSECDDDMLYNINDYKVVVLR